MHRREDFYGPDALEFKPERWETLRPGWEYLPFNGKEWREYWGLYCQQRLAVKDGTKLFESDYASLPM